MIEELYQQYSEPVYRTCLRYTGKQADAEDLLHDVFIKVQENLHGFCNQCDIFTWIYRITVNECLHFLRKRKRESRLDEVPEQHLRIEGPENQIDARVALEEIFKLFDKRTRTLVFMVYLEGMTQEEAANVLEISRRAAVKRLTAFRKRIEKHGKKEQWLNLTVIFLIISLKPY